MASDYSLIDILDELDEAEDANGAIDAEVPVAPPTAAPAASVVREILARPLDNLEDIAKVFRAAMTPAKLLAYAQDCSTPVWLDWMIKLSPKQMKVSGQMDIRAAFLNLGPPSRTK